MAGRLFTPESYQLEKNVIRLYAQLTFGAVEVDQVTFAALASTVDGDYFVLNDWTGLSWAIALDTTGSASNTPTGAAWTAIPSARKVYTNISTATTGSDVSALVHTAINALTGFTANVSAATSTTHQNFTNTGAGVVTAPTVYSKAGAAGTGSITKSVTTAGTANALVAKNSKGFCSLTQTATGKYTIGLGQSHPGALTTIDTYVRILQTKVLFDATGNSGTAPAAPVSYVTGNAVGSAGTVALQTMTAAGTAANPAANEKCFIEIELSNSTAV